jgi:hypothetical protein
MTATTATAFDESDKPLEAADAYEALLRTEAATLDDYLNLAAVYSESHDFGYIAHHELPREFIARAGRRFSEVLEEAEKRFGQHSEINFWRLYHEYVHGGGEPFVDECRRLTKPEESLVPYFYLFLATDRQLYRAEAERLFRAIQGGRSTRERHIRSILARSFSD